MRLRLARVTLYNTLLLESGRSINVASLLYLLSVLILGGIVIKTLHKTLPESLSCLNKTGSYAAISSQSIPNLQGSISNSDLIQCNNKSCSDLTLYATSTFRKAMDMRGSQGRLNPCCPVW